jgi:hypothetical protein
MTLNIWVTELLGQHIATSWKDAVIWQLSMQGNGDNFLYKKQDDVTELYNYIWNYKYTFSNNDIMNFLNHYDSFTIDNLNSFFWNIL